MTLRLTAAFARLAKAAALIYAIELKRPATIEGVAEVIGPCPGMPGLFLVRFEDERRIRKRFVFGGDWQTDPDGMLAALLAHWRASVTPETLFDFTPTDPDKDGPS